MLAKIKIKQAADWQKNMLLNAHQVDKLLQSAGNVRLNTDANLLTEYQLPKDLLLPEENIVDNLKYLEEAAQQR